MPAWLVTLLVNLGVAIVTKYGIPYLEKNWPYLVPLLEDILKAIKKKEPNPNLESAAAHYAAKCNGVGCPPETIEIR